MVSGYTYQAKDGVKIQVDNDFVEIYNANSFRELRDIPRKYHL